MESNCNLNSILNIMAQTPLFSALLPKESEELLTYLELCNYKKGEFIFQQDGSPNSIFIILNGTVDLIRQKEKSEFKIKRFSRGDCFGETDLIGILPYMASAIATEDSSIFKLSKISLHKLSKNNLILFNKFLFNLSREVCRRLHNVDLLLINILSENNSKKNNQNNH